MDTNLTLELFIGRGMIDKSLAKDIKEEMIASGKELPEVLKKALERQACA